MIIIALEVVAIIALLLYDIIMIIAILRLWRDL